MTTVTIRRDDKDNYTGITCFGHADYADKRPLRRLYKRAFAPKTEKDVLCAAISMLVIGTINSLDELSNEKMKVVTNEEDGFIKCDFVNPLQEKSRFLVDSMVFNLENLSKEYGKKYLTIRYERE
ncbi:MAG: ribosomal-processing cysteine protease Prp [Lachnospiraceae bacterium]|nr:ribosomal-processing cysteine protease Prp [Lachnospiraceae bacterium]